MYVRDLSVKMLEPADYFEMVNTQMEAHSKLVSQIIHHNSNWLWNGNDTSGSDVQVVWQSYDNMDQNLLNNT